MFVSGFKEFQRILIIINGEVCSDETWTVGQKIKLSLAQAEVLRAPLDTQFICFDAFTLKQAAVNNEHNKYGF
jgi:hypothetical protein